MWSVARRMAGVFKGVARLPGTPDQLQDLRRRLELLEHMSHGGRATYIGNNRLLVKIVVAERTIAYLVQADDKLFTPWFVVAGGYETDLTDHYVRSLRDDSHCLDVGSNFGYFTCLMARFCPNGRIVGIEPDPTIFELARDNLMINGFSGFAEMLHAAASDSEGELTLYRRNLRSGNTSIMPMPDQFTASLGEPPVTPFQVGSLRIDALRDRFGGRLDFMKVDVEGAEPLVFAGAAETIRDNPGLEIMMEWSPGQIQGAGFDVGQFLQTLAEFGLQPSGLERDGLSPMTFDALAASDYRAGVVLRRPG